MEVIHERCAGLDVHKETVVACLRMREHGQIRRVSTGAKCRWNAEVKSQLKADARCPS